ncbi:MAG TPA: PAS domain-containing protein, partial [Rhodocyclaceae bacterium]
MKSVAATLSQFGQAVRSVPEVDQAHGTLSEGVDVSRVLHELVANLDGMVFRCEIDEHWTMHFVSGGGYRLTGYRPTEMLRGGPTSYERITHPDDRARVRDTIMSAIAVGVRYSVEYRICCKDGAEKWVRESGRGVRDELGKRVIEGYIADISEQVLAHRRLAELELRYRSIFDHSVIG